MTDIAGRQLDVLRGILRGQTRKEIARELGLSPKTVDRHTDRLFKHLGVSRRALAVLKAAELGFLTQRAAQ